MAFEHPTEALLRALRISHGIVEEHGTAQETLRREAESRHSRKLSQTVGMQEYRQLRQHFWRGQGETARAMLERLSSTERAVREAGLRDLVQELARHGEHEHPLHDEVTFRRSTGRATAQQTLWKRRAISRWLGASRRDTEQALRGAVARQETVQQTIHLASESSAARAGSIDRISETESIRAYNVARERGLYVVNKHRPGLYKRWTERVDDSGRPLDNRVGLDSIALHGQLALPGEAFVMPADARVESRFMGKSWAYPPNRPYDRAVVSPWREGWGIPGWMLRDGRRVSR